MIDFAMSRDIWVGIYISDSCYLAYESKPNKIRKNREQSKEVYLLNCL